MTDALYGQIETNFVIHLQNDTVVAKSDICIIYFNDPSGSIKQSK